MNLWNVSLTDMPASITMTVILSVCSIVALLGLKKPALRGRIGVALAIGVGVPLTVFLVVEKIWRPFPDHIPTLIYIADGAAVFVVASFFVQKTRRLVLIVPAVVALVCGINAPNLFYNVYPTLRSLSPKPASVTMDYEAFLKQTTAPQLKGRDAGALITLSFEATKSKFVHRDAIAYIPPAYFTHPDVSLPVIVLLAGNPGSPKQWFGAGDAAQTMDAYQKAHHGFSPVVVSVDGTGSFAKNPLCIDGKRGNTMTWLTEDVPAGIIAKLRVDPDTTKWTLAGLSYGGTCSLQVATARPDVFFTFVDMSGEAEPSLGSRKETVDVFFDGDELAYEKINPITKLENAAATGSDRYRHLAAKFIVGADDHQLLEEMKETSITARAAGIQAEFFTEPGPHNYTVWRKALADVLPFIVTRSGMDEIMAKTVSVSDPDLAPTQS